MQKAPIFLMILCLLKKINVFGTRIDIDKRSPAEMLTEALNVANQSDVIVAVVGEASEMSGEAASRTDITIPESQKIIDKGIIKNRKAIGTCCNDGPSSGIDRRK